MSCNLLNGVDLSCRTAVGGIKNVYILSGSITTVTDGNNSGTITDIDGTGTYWKLELNKGVGSFTEEVAVDVTAGTVGYTQTVEMAFPKLQAGLRNIVKVLAQAPSLSVNIETENGTIDNVGKFFLLGQYRGMTMSAGSGASGVAYADASQYGITLMGEEPFPAQEIATSGSLADALTTITVG